MLCFALLPPPGHFFPPRSARGKGGRNGAGKKDKSTRPSCPLAAPHFAPSSSSPCHVKLTARHAQPLPNHCPLSCEPPLGPPGPAPPSPATVGSSARGSLFLFASSFVPFILPLTYSLFTPFLSHLSIHPRGSRVSTCNPWPFCCGLGPLLPLSCALTSSLEPPLTIFLSFRAVRPPHAPKLEFEFGEDKEGAPLLLPRVDLDAPPFVTGIRSPLSLLSRGGSADLLPKKKGNSRMPEAAPYISARDVI